jgi:hypothetical protein
MPTQVAYFWRLVVEFTVGRAFFSTENRGLINSARAVIEIANDRVGIRRREMSTPDFSATSLQAAQANSLAAVQQQVASLNDALKANYLTAFNNWSQSVMAGRSDNSNPPHLPNAFVVGYFDDPATGPGTQGPYSNQAVRWAYPAVGSDPVCPMPPIPSIPPPPALLPERDDIKNVPLGDTLPVGFKMTDPVTGAVYQKQASATPFGIAYFYARVA